MKVRFSVRIRIPGKPKSKKVNLNPIGTLVTNDYNNVNCLNQETGQNNKQTQSYYTKNVQSHNTILLHFPIYNDKMRSCDVDCYPIVILLTHSEFLNIFGFNEVINSPIYTFDHNNL